MSKLSFQQRQVLLETMSGWFKADKASLEAIIEMIPFDHYAKGSILLRQGERPLQSYYVLQGLVRQTLIHPDGKEVTVEFFSENEPINMFSYVNSQGLSEYGLVCLEPCLLITCDDLASPVHEETVEVQAMKRHMFEKQFTQLQKNYAYFKIQSPEERFMAFVANRQDLLSRVPQYILADYLGITPESFSRFKRRWISSQ